MAGMAVTKRPPVLLIRWENQVQAIGAKDAAKEVVPEEAVTKDMADEVDKVGASTAQHINHLSEALR